MPRPVFVPTPKAIISSPPVNRATSGHAGSKGHLVAYCDHFLAGTSPKEKRARKISGRVLKLRNV
jgi:hypothetical protein